MESYWCEVGQASKGRSYDPFTLPRTIVWLTHLLYSRHANNMPKSISKMAEAGSMGV